MEIVKILGIDPSLRHTGLAVVNYNTELSPHDPKSFKISNCQNINVKNTEKKGKDAILEMVRLIEEEAEKLCYQEVSAVIIETPTLFLGQTWAQFAISSICHISGACIGVFGTHKCHLYKPAEWNKSKKKDVTHKKTIEMVGDPYEWHFEKKIPPRGQMQHILDAASMALWWIKQNYIEEE